MVIYSTLVYTLISKEAVFETGLPGIAVPPGATITFLSAVRIRINFLQIVRLYISIGDWANVLECWRSPSLSLFNVHTRYCSISGTREWPTPTVIIFDYEHCLKASTTTTNLKSRFDESGPSQRLFLSSGFQKIFAKPWLGCHIVSTFRFRISANIFRPKSGIYACA